MAGCGECLAKFGLISFNIIFLLSGVAVLGVGIWVKVDKDVVNMQNLVQFDSTDKSLDTAAYVLIGFGAFVLLVSALGFFAACSQNTVFIALYIAFLVIIFVGEFAGGITAAVYKGKIDEKLPEILQGSLKNYTEGNTLINKAWDYVQVWMSCCGSKGPIDYSNGNFTNPTHHVPTTCCVLSNSDPEKPTPKNVTACQHDADIIQKGTDITSASLKKNGCFSSFEEQIKSHLALIIGVGVGIGMIQLLGIVLACYVCRSDRDNGIA